MQEGVGCTNRIEKKRRRPGVRVCGRENQTKKGGVQDQANGACRDAANASRLVGEEDLVVEGRVGIRDGRDDGEVASGATERKEFLETLVDRFVALYVGQLRRMRHRLSATLL